MSQPLIMRCAMSLVGERMQVEHVARSVLVAGSRLSVDVDEWHLRTAVDKGTESAIEEDARFFARFAASEPA